MSCDNIPKQKLADAMKRQATTLRQIASWCDNPNLSPPASVRIGQLYSTGFLLRRVAEKYDEQAVKLLTGETP